MVYTVFTIGHSTHSIEKFIALLDQQGVDTVCDVRSSPHSRFNPQFSQKNFKDGLTRAGKYYVFLGKELGARSEDPACYRDGRVQYSALARTSLFRNGIDRVKRGLQKGFTIALVCAEKDPLECHRTILVGCALKEQGIEVRHILADGYLESQEEAEERLVRQFKLNQDDLFLSETEITRKAYKMQEERIAYVEEPQSCRVQTNE